MKTMLSMAALAAAALLAGADAHAYCAYPLQTTWYGNPTPISIPVYIVNAGPTRVSLTGVPTTTYAHAVWAAMETYNQLSAKQPRLRFAGYIGSDTTVAANVPAGSIVFDSSGAGCGAGWACDASVGCASPLNSRDAFRVGVLADSCASAPLYSVDSFLIGADLQNILTHELGHALGLQHTDANCPAGYLSGGGDFGIMNSNANLTTGGRRLRRDDIGGMRALWGTDSRTPASRVSTNGAASFSAKSDLPTLGRLTRTPLAGASSMNSTDSLTVLGWVAQNGYPTIMTGHYSSWDAPETVEINASWDGIAAAVGRTSGGTRKVMAAWYANESLSAISGNLRWGVKTYHNGVHGGWIYRSAPNQYSKVVGLGFDDDNRRFVLSTLDSYGRPVIRMINPSTGAAVTTTPFPDTEVCSSVGDPACYVDAANEAVCVIPFSDASTSGPCHGWYTIRPQADGTFVIPAPEISCNTKHYGPYTRLVADTRATGSVGYLTNHDIFSTGSFFWVEAAWKIPRDPAGGVAPPASLLHGENADWGMGVGALNRSTSPFLKFRLYIADP